MSDEFISRMEAALPIDDIVGWLVREYPSATEREVMAMVQVIYQRDYVINPSASVLNTYKVGDNRWDACPQRVAAAGSKS